MPFHIDWSGAGLPTGWQEFRGPLVGGAVALVLALAGRFVRSGVLAAAAGGVGVAAGWYAITGRLWVTAVRPSADHLALLAAAVLLIALVAGWLGRSRGALLGLLLTAAFAGWWLGGAPRSRSDVLHAWPMWLGVAIMVLLYGRCLATERLDPLRLALTALTMAASFHLAMLPPVWTQLALVPALAALALLVLPPMSGLVALPLAVDAAAVGSLAAVTLGRLPRLRVVEIAAVAPLLALWLAPHLASRLRFAGRAAGMMASVLAALIALALVWIAMRVLGR